MALINYAVMHTAKNNLFDYAHYCLKLAEPEMKVAETHKLRALWSRGGLEIEDTDWPEKIDSPGKPIKPDLVDPRKVPRRSFNSQPGRLRLVHAIAHIEFNAINLALDAVYRFRGMPSQYYSDWLQIASEEARHFTMLNAYLVKKGASYGDYSAHNGLWEMAVKTAHSVLVRMALVPRVLEARGLDVTPGMIEKLEHIGDVELADILKIIHHEEIGHVKKGSYWFNLLCEQDGLVPHEVFSQLLDTYMCDAVFGPFDKKSRMEAGFVSQEMEYLESRRLNAS